MGQNLTLDLDKKNSKMDRKSVKNAEKEGQKQTKDFQ